MDLRRQHHADVSATLHRVSTTIATATTPSSSSSSSSSIPTSTLDGRILGTLTLGNIQIQTGLHSSVQEKKRNIDEHQSLQNLLSLYEDSFALNFPPHHLTQLTRQVVPSNNITNQHKNVLTFEKILEDYSQRLRTEHDSSSKVCTRAEKK